MARRKKDKQPLTPEYQAFITALRQKREDLRIEQKELAHLLGITEGTYSGKENGITPISLAEAFALNDYFMKHGLQSRLPTQYIDDLDDDIRIRKIVEFFSSTDAASRDALKKNIDAFCDIILRQQKEIARLAKKNDCDFKTTASRG